MSDYFEDITIETEDIPSSRLRWPEADEEQLTFMRKVYDINLRWSSHNGTFVADIPGDQLDTIEGDHKSRTEAASACRNLLAAARRKIQDEGVNVTIGVTSGYRSATRQLSLWQSYFPNYYSETASHRGSLEGGEHGDKAASYLAGYIRPKVAIPGFSNHQNGIAVDLLNVENGKTVLNKTRSPHPARWRESWLWEWLEANANNFGFYQNTSINEPWHWEYKRRTTGSDEMENDGSIPQLLNRETTPLAETLYVKIDLGLRKERIFKYDDPKNDTAPVQPMTGIFIPKNFVGAGEIDLLIYLHGHKSSSLGKDRSINEYWNSKRFPHFAFREIVNDSGKNIILVAPTLGPRSQARTLTTNAGFTNFISKVIASIAEHSEQYEDREAPEIKSIILACHSGGGDAMYKITQLSEKNDHAKKISECWGFDCTYGPDDANALHKWASGSSDDLPRNLFIYYRKGSGTQKQGNTLKNELPKLSNITVMGLPNSEDHNLIPSKFFLERLHGSNDSAESFHEEECGCDNEEFESDYTGENTVTFPSGEQLTIASGDEAQGEEYYDPNQSGNPLLDTSGANKDIKLSANFTVAEFAKSGGKKFDKARIDPNLISCLQAIRDQAGKSVTISSGYRSYGYNQRLAKGSKNVAKLSQHMSGRAADIKITGMTGFEIAKIALDVCSCEIGIGLAPGFAHIDVRGHSEVWRYAGDPDEMNELVEKIKAYQKSCTKKSASSEKYFSTEAKNFIVRRSPLSAAIDLFKRGYINYDALIAISNGERNIDALTDMVFSYRHPQQNGLSGIINVTDNDYRRLRKEWQEIRLRIIEPIFRSEKHIDNYSEISTGRPFIDTGSGGTRFSNPNRETEDRHDEVKGRTEWFYSTRMPRDAGRRNIPYYSIATAKVRQLISRRGDQVATESLFETPPGTSLLANDWTPLGPSAIANGQATGSPPVSGRINSIAVSPNGERIYIGTANGGVWYSENKGKNWVSWLGFTTTNINDYDSGNEADSLSVGSIAVVFGGDMHSDEIYVGTGEPVFFHGGTILPFSSYFGIGIKHYLNKKMRVEANTELAGQSIFKIVIDPTDKARVFAATSIGLFKRKTTGAWEKIIGSVGTPFLMPNSMATDIIITGNGASKKHYVVFRDDKAYVANHDLTTWSSLTGLPAGFRTILASGNQINSPVYALAGTGDGTVYKLDGNTFKLVSATPPALVPSGTQGHYNLILGVDPDNDNNIFIAGNHNNISPYNLSLYKCVIAGFNCTSFTYIGTGIHADGHAIAFSKTALSNTDIWIGCDGGLFYSPDPGRNNSYEAKNVGIASVQTSYLAQWEQSDVLVLAGAQDNGVLTSYNNQAWWEGVQSDGGGIAIDPKNEFRMIAQLYLGYFVKSNNAGRTWSNLTLAFDPNLLFGLNEFDRTPFSASIDSYYSITDLKTMVALGTDRLWLSYDWGINWQTLPNNNLADRVDTIVAIKIASATKIFAATQNTIARYDKSAVVVPVGATIPWTKTNIPLPLGVFPAGAIITAIALDPRNASSFYIALGGAGFFERCLYYNHTTSSWQKAGPPTNTLNIPCHAIVVDPVAPYNVYLGSDVGVWKGVVNGNPWILRWAICSQGLPEAAITDLKIHNGARLLRAATHGRGIWEFAIDHLIGRPTDIYLRANHSDSGRMKAGSRFPWIKTAADPSRIPVVAASPAQKLTMSPDIKVRPISAMKPALANVDYYIFGHKLQEEVRDPNWQRGNLIGTNQVFVQVNNRGLHVIPPTNIRVILLMANASAGSTPDLPAGFTAHINSGNVDPRWLAGSNWKFGDPANPVRNSVPFKLNVRTPQIVQFDVRFSDLPGLTAASKVALLAFITTVDASDRRIGATVKVDDLIMSDKHVAQRYVVFV